MGTDGDGPLASPAHAGPNLPQVRPVLKHNVWAGRQRYWHYGVARTYLAVLPFVVLAVVSSPWWLGVLASGAMARVAKSLWTKREGRGLAWLLNPVQFVAVGAILIVIDVATFAGWVLAATTHPPVAPVLAAQPTEQKC